MLWPSPSFVLHDDLVQSGIAGFHPPAGLNQAQFHFWAKPELDEWTERGEEVSMIFRLLHKFERHAERVVHLHARYAIALLLAATLMFAAMGSAMAQEPEGAQVVLKFLFAGPNRPSIGGTLLFWLLGERCAENPMSDPRAALTQPSLPLASERSHTCTAQ